MRVLQFETVGFSPFCVLNMNAVRKDEPRMISCNKNMLAQAVGNLSPLSEHSATVKYHGYQEKLIPPHTVLLSKNRKTWLQLLHEIKEQIHAFDLFSIKPV